MSRADRHPMQGRVCSLFETVPLYGSSQMDRPDDMHLDMLSRHLFPDDEKQGKLQ